MTRFTTIPAWLRNAGLGLLIGVGGSGLAAAQTGTPGSQQSPMVMGQATQPGGPGQSGAPGMMQPGQPRMMQPDRMGPGMADSDRPATGQPMMSPDMMRPGMHHGMPMMGMHGRMMKVIFAIADTDGDGALTFEEVTAIHERIFTAMDSDKDGKLTPAEIRAFMQD